jgi:Polysaccharide deacetylase
LIYFTHGVVSAWKSERISHGLMLSESILARHLQRRVVKYVSLAEALAGRGDALTVDDASYAGLQATLLAREFGHAVSWFVNGMYVERGLPYFPFLLSWTLDETRKASCSFDGQHWNLSDQDGRRALRLRVKHSYMRMRSCEELGELVEMFSDLLEVGSSTMEKSLRTVTATDLAVAVAAGVELQNHGWTHLNPESFSAHDLAAEVQLNEAYLSRFRQASTLVFAPPFGRHVSLDSGVADYILLAERGVSSYQRNEGIINRSDLHLAPTRMSSALFSQTA